MNRRHKTLSQCVGQKTSNLQCDRKISNISSEHLVDITKRSLVGTVVEIHPKVVLACTPQNALANHAKHPCRNTFATKIIPLQIVQANNMQQ